MVKYHTGDSSESDNPEYHLKERILTDLKRDFYSFCANIYREHPDSVQNPAKYFLMTPEYDIWKSRLEDAANELGSSTELERASSELRNTLINWARENHTEEDPSYDLALKFLTFIQ